MSPMDYFLALTPKERVETVIRAKDEFPNDPHPAMRCVASNPHEAFPLIDPAAATEIGSYVRLLAHFGHIDLNDAKAVSIAGERYILALAVLRMQAMAPLQ